MPKWTISQTTLAKLWTHVYPRIVGRMWYSEEYEQDMRDPAKLKAEFIEAGVDPGQLPIEVQWFSPLQVQFILTSEKLYLPCPPFDLNTATEGSDLYRRLLQGYAHRGMLLPVRDYQPDAETQDFLGRYAKRQNLHHQDMHPAEIWQHQRPAGSVLSSAALNDDQRFTGEQLWGVFDQLPRIYARAWASETFAEHYQKEPLTVFVDVGMPHNMDFEVDPQQQDALIMAYADEEKTAGKDWKMVLPIPPKPTIDDMVISLAAGVAENPLYSKCIGSGPCGPH